MKFDGRIAVFGGRFITDEIYNDTVEIGKRMAQKNWLVFCGGGEGVMEAIAKGVALGGGTITTGDGTNGYVTGYNAIKPPSTDDFDEKSLLLIVDGPAGADRHVEIPRAINVGAFSMAHQKAPQKVVIATEFKVRAPKGSVSQFQELFRIVDNTNDSEVFDIN